MASKSAEWILILSIIERFAMMFASIGAKLRAAHAEGRTLNENDLKALRADLNTALDNAETEIAALAAEEAAAPPEEETPTEEAPEPTTRRSRRR